MSQTRLSRAVARSWRIGSLLLVPVAVLVVGVVGLPPPRTEVARAGVSQEAPAPVRRPLHNMLEGYADGTVVALEYHQTTYCPTTPSSDLDPPFGQGDGHPQSEDPSEYQVPQCFFGDSGTGSILPDHLHAGAFPGLKTFFGMVPWFAASAASGGPPVALVSDKQHPGQRRRHPLPGARPDHNGHCPAGPPRCVTSIAALRAAQKTGQASVDVPSNLYFYFSVHPEER